MPAPGQQLVDRRTRELIRAYRRSGSPHDAVLLAQHISRQENDFEPAEQIYISQGLSETRGLGPDRMRRLLSLIVSRISVQEFFERVDPQRVAQVTGLGRSIITSLAQIGRHYRARMGPDWEQFLPSYEQYVEEHDLEVPLQSGQGPAKVVAGEAGLALD